MQLPICEMRQHFIIPFSTLQMTPPAQCRPGRMPPRPPSRRQWDNVSFWRHFQSTLRLMICVYGRADPAVLIIRFLLIFGSTIRPNRIVHIVHCSVPNRILGTALLTMTFIFSNVIHSAIVTTTLIRTIYLLTS